MYIVHFHYKGEGGSWDNLSGTVDASQAQNNARLFLIPEIDIVYILEPNGNKRYLRGKDLDN